MTTNTTPDPRYAALDRMDALLDEAEAHELERLAHNPIAWAAMVRDQAIAVDRDRPIRDGDNLGIGPVWAHNPATPDPGVIDAQAFARTNLPKTPIGPEEESRRNAQNAEATAHNRKITNQDLP